VPTIDRLLFCVISLSAIFTISPCARSATEEVFNGVISDSPCAFNVHGRNQTHAEMLKTHKVGTTDADCVWGCVKHFGGLFVLQSAEKVYRLDKQDLDRALAAQQVEVRGVLNPQTNTIHVVSITLAGKPSKTSLPSR
jgi:hypothetical protein